MTAREGLEKARSFIEAERQHRIDSFTIGGDYATADESEIGYLAEVDDALAAVTDAIAALSAPAPDEVVLRVRCVQNYPDLPVWEVYVGKIYIGIIVWRDGYYAIRTIYIAGATDNVQYPTLAAAQAALVEWAQCRRTSTA